MDCKEIIHSQISVRRDLKIIPNTHERLAKAMVDYLRFLPDPPEECRDPALFRMLNEFHFVRWHPDLEARRDEMKREIFEESILRRAESGTADPCERLRFYCGELLIWVRRNYAAAFTLTLLGDSCEEVRGGHCTNTESTGRRTVHRTARQTCSDRCLTVRSRMCRQRSRRTGSAVGHSRFARTPRSRSRGGRDGTYSKWLGCHSTGRNDANRMDAKAAERYVEIPESGRHRSRRTQSTGPRLPETLQASSRNRATPSGSI